jgi:metal-responsive CopG/Arc/MetJ family transcriptional regulator
MKNQKPNPQRRLDGKKKLISLTLEMERMLRSFCRDKGIESESELIRQAIVKYITPENYQDETLKLKGLQDLHKLCEEIRDMVDILFSYTRLMHINLLAYNPEIDAALADAAFKSATARHERFFKSFQESLKNNPPFFERLLHSYFTEDQDEPR